MSSSRHFISGILFAMIIIMGFVTKGMGRPLNTAAFTIHKLVALAFVVYVMIDAIGLLKSVQGNALMWTMVLASALAAAALFATGAILSFEKPAARIIHVLHGVSPVFLAISVLMTYYLAAKRHLGA